MTAKYRSSYLGPPMPMEHGRDEPARRLVGGWPTLGPRAHSSPKEGARSPNYRLPTSNRKQKPKGRNPKKKWGKKKKKKEKRRIHAITNSKNKKLPAINGASIYCRVSQPTKRPGRKHGKHQKLKAYDLRTLTSGSQTSPMAWENVSARFTKRWTFREGIESVPALRR